jgi:hypothetical protein
MSGELRDRGLSRMERRILALAENGLSPRMLRWRADPHGHRRMTLWLLGAGERVRCSDEFGCAMERLVRAERIAIVPCRKRLVVVALKAGRR